jgi:hypothetical protein
MATGNWKKKKKKDKRKKRKEKREKDQANGPVLFVIQ